MEGEQLGRGSSSREAVREAEAYSNVPSIIQAMIEVTPVPALEEIAAALRAKLFTILPARERRLEELWLLAELVRANEPSRIGGDLPWVSPEVYDRERKRRSDDDSPKRDALSSDALRQRYGAWVRACLAAASIDECGAVIGPWQPWVAGARGIHGPANPYSVEEAKQALRDCAHAIGRMPRSYQYHEWRSARSARLRAQGIVPRIPVIKVIYDLLAPERGHRDGWEKALAAAFGEPA